MGKTFLISLILVLIFGYLAIIIPLAPADQNAWYSGLYKDVTLDPKDRFNIWLVILESVLLSLFYLFLTITLAGYAEINNQIPSWTQLVISAIIALVMSYLLPQVSVGEASLAGGSGSGYNHFTPDMQLWTFLGTLFGIILMTLYLIYSQPAEAKN